MILGISASGRINGITGETIRSILEATGLPNEYISLAGKTIIGCRGCLGCASDNTCKIKDDWNEIGEKMKVADAIIFGAPNYCGRMNALGHAFWERTFCFRHQENFHLAGKLGVIVATEYEENNFVRPEIEGYMRGNMMAVVETMQVGGFSQCYTCGYGENCGVGHVVNTHGVLDEIRLELLPPRFSEQTEAVNQAKRIAKILRSVLKNRDAMNG